MEFISPESPILPTSSAVLVLIISSLSWKFLGLNQNIIGFIFSVVFSIIWMNKFKINLLKKLFYIFINAIVIFVTALGGNTVISHPILMDYSYSNTQASEKIARSFFDPWINR